MAESSLQPDESSLPPKPKPELTETEGIESAASGAATGLGCLGVATLPFSIILLVFIIIAIAWLLGRIMAAG